MVLPLLLLLVVDTVGLATLPAHPLLLHELHVLPPPLRLLWLTSRKHKAVAAQAVAARGRGGRVGRRAPPLVALALPLTTDKCDAGCLASDRDRALAACASPSAADAAVTDHNPALLGGNDQRALRARQRSRVRVRAVV